MTVNAVLFDLGGVVFDSPIEFIVRFEREHGLPENFVGRLMGRYASADGPWQQLERGEVALPDFCENVDRDMRREGHHVSTEAMMQGLSQHAAIRPMMLEAIRRLRGAGLQVSALTNNWVTDDARDGREHALRGEFDHFVESCKVGMRKPEERIYRHTLSVIEREASQVVFLDDIGGNLKVARNLGMTTIKVVDADSALRQLGEVVGVDLVSA